jgi:sterol desaturase/sphingolipid hydroxylase (fatty acid hydroxylase superfamily)
MVVALVTTSVFVVLNLLGWLASVRIERTGLPPERSAQTARRRRGDLRRRRGLIAANGALVVGASLVGLGLVSPAFDLAWPSAPVFLGQLAVLVLVDDLAFYGLHRAMHEHAALWRLHRVHHEAYAPSPSESLYTHPGETLLVTLPIALGAAVVFALWGAVSFAPFLAYVAARQVHELFVHSGLRSTWLPSVGIAPNEHHDLHHHRPQCGNYASTLLLWDRVFGTLTEDPRPAERAARAARRAARALGRPANEPMASDVAATGTTDAGRAPVDPSTVASSHRSLAPVVPALLAALLATASSASALAGPAVGADADGFVRGTLLVDADVAEVRRVLADGAWLARAAPDVARASATALADGCERIDLRLHAASGGFHVATRRCRSEGGWASTLLESNAFTAWESSWTVVDTDAGAELRYAVRTRVRLPVPESLLRRRSVESVRRSLEAVAEALAAEPALADASLDGEGAW